MKLDPNDVTLDNARTKLDEIDKYAAELATSRVEIFRRCLAGHPEAIDGLREDPWPLLEHVASSQGANEDHYRLEERRKPRTTVLAETLPANCGDDEALALHRGGFLPLIRDG